MLSMPVTPFSKRKYPKMFLNTATYLSRCTKKSLPNETRKDFAIRKQSCSDKVHAADGRVQSYSFYLGTPYIYISQREYCTQNTQREQTGWYSSKFQFQPCYWLSCLGLFSSAFTHNRARQLPSKLISTFTIIFLFYILYNQIYFIPC
jgi:hypothetical protein